MKFKTGDVVICVQGYLGGPHTDLVTGQEYTILTVTLSGAIMIKGIPNYTWPPYRFILSQPHKNEQKLKKVLGLE